MRRILLFSLVGLAGCAMVDEPRMTPNSIVPGQRTVVVVYPSPGPWVIREDDTKAEAAAKVLPGVGFLVEAAQDDRDLAVSKDLKQYLPRWTPAELLTPLLMESLGKAGYPGKLLYPYQAELSTETVRGLNKAKDVLDWQRTYFYDEPGRLPARDYSRFLALDDALVLEVNLRYGCLGNDDGNMIPRLYAAAKLLRAGTMRPLYRKELMVEDTGGARTLFEFETLPLQLIDRWKGLIPALASRIADDMRASALAGIGLSSGTVTGPPGLWPGVVLPEAGSVRPALSTATVSSFAVAASTPPAVAVSTTTSAPPAVAQSSAPATTPEVAASSPTATSSSPTASSPPSP